MESLEANGENEASSWIAEPMLINLGPAHPATHGTVRSVIELDGDSVGYALTCETLLGVEVPERCQWYRMALGELTRLAGRAPQRSADEVAPWASCCTRS
jgi:NADH-quinone oxidoreductase subunit D